MARKSYKDWSQKQIQTLKIILSAYLMAQAFCNGIQTTVTGPALPDLRRRYSSTVEEISRAIAFKNIGYMIGALAGGITCDRFQSLTLVWLIVHGVTLSIATLLIPFGGNLPVLGMIYFLQGLGQGFGTPVYVSATTALWRKKSATPMHIIMFGFPLGTVLSPLIAAPFLSERTKPNLLQNTNGSLLDEHQYSTQEPPPSISILSPSNTESAERIHMIFVVAAILGLTVRAAGICLYFTTPKEVFIATKRPKKSFREILSPGSCSGGGSMFGAVLVVMLCFFVTFEIAGMRMNNLMYSYVVESGHKFTRKQAVMFSFAMNLANMGGRGLALLVSYFFPIQVILATEVFGNLLSSAGIAFLGVRNSALLWVFTILCNACNGPMFPAQYSWTDRYIILYSFVVSLTNISMSGSGYIFEWFNGYLYTNFHPKMILYTRLGFASLCALTYVTMQIFASSRGERNRSPLKNDEAVKEGEQMMTDETQKEENTNGKINKTS